MSEKNAVKREIKMRIAISVGEDEEFQLTIGKGRFRRIVVLLILTIHVPLFQTSETILIERGALHGL